MVMDEFMDWLPLNQADVERARALAQRSPDELSRVVSRLIPWLKNDSWPIAIHVATALCRVEGMAVPAVTQALRSKNKVFQRNLIRLVVSTWPKDAVLQVHGLLSALVTNSQSWGADLEALRVLLKHALIDREAAAHWLAFKRDLYIDHTAAITELEHIVAAQLTPLIDCDAPLRDGGRESPVAHPTAAAGSAWEDLRLKEIDLFASCAGTWHGTNRLWDPHTQKPDDTPSRMSLTPILGGRFVRIDYSWSYHGEPQEGSYLLGGDAKDATVTLHWIDTWHMATKGMVCQGPAGDAHGVDVRGSYAAPPGPDWGWRITLQLDSGNQTLQGRMYNVEPAGREAPAVEATYTRER